MKHVYARSAILIVLLSATTASLQGQTTSTSTTASGGAAATAPPTGAITGRVTIGGGETPAVGVAVVLTEAEYGPRRQSLAKAVTDSDGRFRLTGIDGGRYRVSPIAPALVFKEDVRYGESGKLVTISDGEAISDVDFQLQPGGVITGRITEADGRPVIGESVRLMRVDENRRELRQNYFGNPFNSQTDDRGVYRLYGLHAGRYLVSVGEARDSGMVRFGSARGYYARTFYPNTTAQAEAKIVEVTAGGESTGVDIKLGSRSETFAATRRMVDAGSGSPLVNTPFSYGVIYSRGSENQVVGGGNIGLRTDASGNFRIEGLMPGRYAVFAAQDGETYSEPTPFEIDDKDVSNLEVKVRLGLSVSGVVAIDGTTDRSVLAKLSQLPLHAFVRSSGLNSNHSTPVKMNQDGSFRIGGLRPGKLNFGLADYLPQSKGFYLLRVEHNGAAQPEGIELTPNQSITSVRIVLAYGTATVRGQVNVTGGKLLEGSRMIVFARRVGEESSRVRGGRGTEVDARGRFVIENLSVGEYELNLYVMLAYVPGTPASPRFPPVKQNLTVTGAGESQVTLTLDVSSAPGNQGAVPQ